MMEVSHFSLENNIYILDINPFRFKMVKNAKKTIVKKLSAIRSFVKYLEDQCHMNVKLLADETIKVPQSLPKPIEESIHRGSIEYRQFRGKTTYYYALWA